MQIQRPYILRLASALTLLVIAAACDAATEPLPLLELQPRDPQIASINSASYAPSGYLGITADPADPDLRFAATDVVEMTVVSSTGDSIVARLGSRYCDLAPRYFRVCHEYIVILDTTVTLDAVKQELKAAGFATNPIGNRFAVVFDLSWRSEAIARLLSVPAVDDAGHNSIGWIDKPPTDLAGRGLHGAIALTTESSAAHDDVLSVPLGGFVTVHYRQPDGTVLTQRIDITSPH